MKAAGDARNAPASVLQIFPPSVEFRNVELGKTYTATLKVKVRVVCVHYMKYNIIPRPKCFDRYQCPGGRVAVSNGFDIAA